HVSITSPLMQPSPSDRRVGIRIVTFEACSGFTHVTARRIAQPPTVTFVTRLQPRHCTTELLVSYRTYRQLSGWNPPPLVIRAVRAHCQKQNKTNTDYRVTLLPFLMTNNVNVSGAFRRDRAIIHCPSQSKAGGAAAIHSPSMSMATRKQAGDFTLLRLIKSPDVFPSGTTQGRTRCTVVSTVFHEGKDNSLDRRGL